MELPKIVKECYESVGMSPRGRDVKAIEIAIKEAKKQVFVHIDHTVFIEHLNDKQINEYNKVKKRHLSPSADGADNNSFKTIEKIA